MKLSIAITTYNHEDYIIECLESIENQQTNFEFEVLVADDASKDQTTSIIEQYISKSRLRITLIKRETNIGYTANLYQTILSCTGDYIAIFDGDDVMLPGKLQYQVNYLDAYPEIGLIGHTARPFISNNPSQKLSPLRPKKNKRFYTIQDFIQYGSIFPNTSKMFRRHLIPKEGFSIPVKFIADLAFTLEIMSNNTTARFNDVEFVRYRIHSSSIMKTMKGKEDFLDQMKLIRYVREKYGRQYEQIQKQYISFVLLSLGKYEISQSNFKRAKKILLLSIRYYPFYRYTQYIYFFGCIFTPQLIKKKVVNQ
jgi:glycosyltransferase involved in cell wall biosynthesis